MGSKVLIGFFVSMAVAATSMAQTTTASLLGVVRDKTGAAIPEAQVTAQNVLTSFTRATATYESAPFLITNLPLGEYTISPHKPGFARSRQSGSTLHLDHHAPDDLA